LEVHLVLPILLTVLAVSERVTPTLDLHNVVVVTNLVLILPFLLTEFVDTLLDSPM